MPTNKVNYPSQFDTYGREISRRSSLYHNVDCECYDPSKDNNTRGSLCSVDYNLDNAGDIVSPLPIKDVNYNGCKSLYQRVHSNCTEESELINDCTCPNEYHNNAFYFKYKNIRIRYVGFVYSNVNYIVDFDNRKVIYKPCQESCYVKLNRKISVSNNSITGSYSLGFNTINCNTFVNVEIYPNDINHCTVTLTSLKDYSKELLNECYTCIEYFDINNMTDKYGNLITFVDYNEVLSLTKEDLASIYSQNELVEILYSIIRNIKCSKDMTNVVKSILLSIKNKLNDNTYMGDEDNMPICNDSCNCGCNNNGNGNTTPPYIKPNQEAYQNFNENKLLGLWESECKEYLSLKDDHSAEYGRFDNFKAMWSILYIMSNDGKEYKDIILRITDDYSSFSTDLPLFGKAYEFSVNPITLELTNTEEGMSHNKFNKITHVTSNFSIDLEFKFFYTDESTKKIIYPAFKDGQYAEMNGFVTMDHSLFEKKFEKLIIVCNVTRNDSKIKTMQIESNMMNPNNDNIFFSHKKEISSEFNNKEEFALTFEINSSKEIDLLNTFFNIGLVIYHEGGSPEDLSLITASFTDVRPQ